MKTTTITTIITAVAAMLVTTACGDRARDIRTLAVPTAVTVTLPPIPDSYVIAGDTIDLTSYENRERLDRELLAFTYSHTNTVLGLKRANRYFPVIEPILQSHGIPDDMKLLTIVESYLNPFARSGAGAAGIWQFMPATGREFGLEVSKSVDQRYDIAMSTEAACRYLKQAYGKFHDWLSVAASYNAGQGAVRRFSDRHLSDDATHWWMTEQTSRYIFRLIAVKMIYSDPSAYGIVLTADQFYPPLDYDTVAVRQDIRDLAAFAKGRGLTYYQLRDANPWLRQQSLTVRKGKTYRLLIPTQESMHYDPAATVVHDPRCAAY